MTEKIAFKELFTSLLQTIDVVSFHVNDHHKHVANIVLKMAEHLNWNSDKKRRAVIAAGIHDIGAISISERNQLIQLDTEYPHNHAFLGYMMLKDLKGMEEIAEIIKYHHWKWDFGRGLRHLADPVPEESHLIFLADRIDILLDRDVDMLSQKDELVRKVEELVGAFFSPEFFDAFLELAKEEKFWLDVMNIPIEATMAKVLDHYMPEFDLEGLLEFAKLFSKVIDFRSEYTAGHSSNVAVVARKIGELLGLDKEVCMKLEIAGYFHDIGKIVIPNEILEKPGQLTEGEFNMMKAHSYYSDAILKNVSGMGEISQWASYHHEKLDGSGYPFKLKKNECDLGTRIIAFADVFSALAENRPHRRGMKKEHAISTLKELVECKHIDDQIFELVLSHFDEIERIRSFTEMEVRAAYDEMNAVKDIFLKE